MDALSDVLRLVRLTGAVFLEAKFTAPWCVGAPTGVELCMQDMPTAQHIVMYHLVTEGSCEVTLTGEAPQVAQANDLIIIPGGEAHSLGSDLTDPLAIAARVVLKRSPGEALKVQFGGGGPMTGMVCGYLACDSALFKTVLATLPRLMIVKMGDDPGGQWLSSSLQFSLAQSSAPTAGASAVLSKLSELMLVEAMRRHIESLPPGKQGWLAGLRDEFVGKALALLHSQPSRAWTVDELAGNIGLSRSALAERFSSILGQPPMRYLASWRLQLAADLLRSTQRTIATISAQVGYDSEAAFSRAFKREFGMAPAAWRRTSPVPLGGDAVAS